MIRILPNGIIEVVGEKDGLEWRTTITPGDIATAEYVLDAKELAMVQAAWTPDIVQAWHDTYAVPTQPAAPQSPSLEERVAELEAALIEYITNGTVDNSRLQKLQARLPIDDSLDSSVFYRTVNL